VLVPGQASYRGSKRRAICSFVSLKAGVENSAGLVDELKAHLAKAIDAIAWPDEILFAAEFPKTGSGKIVAGCCATSPTGGR
jgi:acetyl-CoA synthetase